ncbi:MAG: NUDIX hydrolase [Chloroflexota bacterium]
MNNSKETATKPYAVRGILVKDNEILLIQHQSINPVLFNKWAFPGGRLDPHETNPLDALHREMREELSIDIDVIGEVGVFYNRMGFDYTIFAAHPLDAIGPIQTEEIRDYVWLTPAEIYEWHTKSKLQFGFEMEAVSAYLKKFG